MDIQKI